MAITIRVAVASDLDAIVAIYNHAVAEEATADSEPVTVEGRRAWFARHSPGRYPILVAEHDGEVLGWSSFSEYRPGRGALRHTAEISYYVHADHRRKGVATELVRASIAMCPRLGFRTLFGILLDDNAASIRLLEKHGFETWGHLPRVAAFGGREVGHVYCGLRVTD